MGVLYSECLLLVCPRFADEFYYAQNEIYVKFRIPRLIRWRFLGRASPRRPSCVHSGGSWRLGILPLLLRIDLFAAAARPVAELPPPPLQLPEQPIQALSRK